MLNLSEDITLEILCKLNRRNLSIFLINKKMISIYKNNQRYILKKIINAYNLFFTDISNILYINKITKTLCIDIAMDMVIEKETLNDLIFLLRNDCYKRINVEWVLRGAIRHERIEMIDYLVKIYPDIITYEVLADAIQHRRLKILEFLINCIDINKYSLIGVAANYNYSDVIKLLINLGADIHYSHEYALLMAAGYGNLDIVKLLISLGADVNAHNECNDYALQRAAQGGHLEVTRFLIEKGAVYMDPVDDFY